MSSPERAGNGSCMALDLDANTHVLGIMMMRHLSMVESGLGLYSASTRYRHALKNHVARRPLDIAIEIMQIVAMWRDPAWDPLANDPVGHARHAFSAQQTESIEWKGEQRREQRSPRRWGPGRKSSRRHDPFVCKGG